MSFHQSYDLQYMLKTLASILGKKDHLCFFEKLSAESQVTIFSPKMDKRGVTFVSHYRIYEQDALSRIIVMTMYQLKCPIQLEPELMLLMHEHTVFYAL